MALAVQLEWRDIELARFEGAVTAVGLALAKPPSGCSQGGNRDFVVNWAGGAQDLHQPIRH